MARLLLVSIHMILSLLIFQTGFLLKRQELTEHSKCGDVKAPVQTGTSCWSPRQFRRVVLVVVDALRHDFVRPLAEGEASAPYRGKMRKIERLVADGKASIGVLTVDPPTTTLQRIKAMTTGTLPTFIDAGSNFSPDAAVNEDSLIAQAHANNVSVTLLGDDTWLSLYPTQFTKTVAYDSFDIHDLDSVDDAIRPVFAQEIADKEASGLLIAHFLGVDHTGHKHGPLHPMMASKLTKMDDIISETYEALAEDELLMVIGDHGMTMSGDHGGDSEDEVNAAIVIAAKTRKLKLPSGIQQIDIVPTIALLLGLPIPFSNLGTVISDIFPEHLKRHVIEANYEQIKIFAETYAHRNGFSELHGSIGREAFDEQDMLIKMSRVQTLLRAVWTRFDSNYINMGVLGLFEAIIYLFADSSLSVESFIFRSGCIFLQSALLRDHGEGNLAHPVLGLSLFLSLISSLTAIGKKVLHQGIPMTSATFGALLVVVHSVSLFSNSFVVYEPKVLVFLVASLLAAVGYRANRRPKQLYGWVKTVWEQRSSNLCYLIATVAILIRAEPAFHRCREEEVDCVGYLPTAQLSTITVTERFQRVAIGAVTILLLNYFIISRNPASSGLMRMMQSLTWPLHLIVIAYSVLANGPDLENVQNALVYIPLGVYAFTALSILVIVHNGYRKEVNGPFTASRFAATLLWPFYLLVGDGLQPAVVFFFIIVLYCSQFPSDQLPSTITLLIPLGFYLTGHSPSLTAIPWHAAFIGIPGSLGLRLLPAVLVLAHISISALFTPVTLLVSVTTRPRTLDTTLALMAIRVLAACLAASHHRRHLMVWKIFAPKFIFEAVLFCAFVVALNLVSVCLRRRWRRVEADGDRWKKD